MEEEEEAEELEEEEEEETMQDEGGQPEEQGEPDRSDLGPIVDSVFGQVSVGFHIACLILGKHVI